MTETVMGVHHPDTRASRPGRWDQEWLLRAAAFGSARHLNSARSLPRLWWKIGGKRARRAECPITWSRARE